MDTHNQILWIKAACWAGVLPDAVVTILMLQPAQFARTFGIGTDPGPLVAAGLLAGAPLMAGWTLLLFRAHRSPVERKEVLLITVVPVLAGFIALEVFLTGQGLTSLAALAPILALQAIPAVWYLAGYHAARNLAAAGVT